MDKEQKSQQSFKWLPEQMPGVSALINARRKQDGAAWVAECWKRGVVGGEPGWFWAGEGALMVGTMFDDPVILQYASAKITRTQAMLVMKDKPAVTA